MKLGDRSWELEYQNVEFILTPIYKLLTSIIKYTMTLFYAPDIAVSPELPEEESAHAVRVLRLNEGDELFITDGKGTICKAVVSRAHPKHCEVRILETHEQPPLWPAYLHIAVSPAKSIDRMEWFVEKAVEIGTDAVTFLQCRFSERKDIKIPRMEKVAVSAMKQSLKARLPKLSGMTDFRTFIAQPFDGRKFIAHCGEGERKLLKHAYQPNQSALILIGPEGDFSPEEVAFALQNGYEPVSLGNSRLRTETAALAACHTIQLLNQ